MLIYLQVIETEEDKNKFEDIYQKYRGLMPLLPISISVFTIRFYIRDCFIRDYFRTIFSNCS